MRRPPGPVYMLGHMGSVNWMWFSIGTSKYNKMCCQSLSYVRHEPMEREQWIVKQWESDGQYEEIDIALMSSYHTGVPLPKWINLTHWDRVTHQCVSKLSILGSDNGLSLGRRQAIIWTNGGILLIWPLGTHFSEVLVEINTFSFKKMYLKISCGKWRSFVSASMG